MARHTSRLRTSSAPTSRRGAMIVLTAIMLVFFLGLAAFAIDIGIMLLARTELQNAADAAALAAAGDLIPDSGGLTGNPDMTGEIASARAKAVQFAGLNQVRTTAPVVNLNTANSTTGDVVIGYLSNPSDPTQSMSFSNMNLANAAQVTVRRIASENGEVALFFSKVLGVNSKPATATATAAIRTEGFTSFSAPSDGSNLGMLPIALKLDTWNSMLAGQGSDSYGWSSTKGVTNKGDSVLEMDLFPDSTTPGNFGTVDIGTTDNSTSDIARQVLYGISPQDMQALPNGSLGFDANGQLSLNGDTGVSASIQNELRSIIGQPRMIPIYSTVANPGDNATYTIVQFVGIRVMDVKLTGALKLKSVTIQPAYVAMKGGTGGGNQTSKYVYSYSVWLVR
jgi:Flp pilus assembly protein TadG